MNQWNWSFTQLVRKSRPTQWGNWSLGTHIKPGAVGIIDPSSGDFKLIKESVPGVELSEQPVNRSWDLHSSNVTRRVLTGTEKTSYIDPETGLKITPEMEIEWKFDRSGSLISKFALEKESYIKDITVLQHEFDWLAEQAASVSMGSQGRVSQGFGVISSVLYARSGLNVGANDTNAFYRIGGSLKAINSLLGEKGASHDGKGTYTLSREEKSLDKHLWPASENSEAGHPLPIAFGFVSFEGNLMIPNWIGKIGAFRLFIDSKFRSATSYVVIVQLTYDTPKGPHQEHATILGGSSRSFADIPLAATNLQVKMAFKGIFNDDTHVLSWASPLGQWLTGERNIDLKGTWPGQTQVIVKEEPGR